MDPANLLLSFILGGIALAAAIIKGVQWSTRNMLIEEGLIRPGRRGETANHWPNGWHNLPDTLEGIYDQINNGG